jgi:hypothetical protein
MTRRPTEQLALFVGLDWADANPDLCLPAAGAETRECGVLAHTPDTIDAWVRPLRQRGQGPPRAIGVELHKGPSGNALRTYDLLVLFPVNPLPLARYRDAFAPSHAKDAPTAAARLLELLLMHRDQLTPFKPQSPAMRALAPPIEHRRRLVGDTVRLTNRLTSALKSSSPVPTALPVQALATQRRVTVHAIEDFDHAMAQRAQRHPDFPSFDTLPGAGAVVAPRLRVAWGEQRDRDPAADDRQT